MSGKKTSLFLVIDDDSVDRMRIRRMLKEGSSLGEFVLDEAENKATGLEMLVSGNYDLVFLDLHLPDGSGLSVLSDLLEMDAEAPPVIMQTVLDDDDAGVRAVELGAQDYLVKGRFTSSELVRSIRHSIERHKLLMQKEQLLTEIRKLKSLIPICAKCKKIRDDSGYWSAVEEYLKIHAHIVFSHGLCPECKEEELAEIERYKASHK